MSNTKWKAEDLDGYVEVTPVVDVKQHYAGDECWCSPKTEDVDGKAMIVHHLYDNCKSYNKQIGELEEVILPRPDWLPEGERLNGVPVDHCIAPVIEHLWDKGVRTLNSCCGHGKQDPSIVLKAGQDVMEVFDLIAEKDSRSYTLHWWENGELQAKSLSEENI